VNVAQDATVFIVDDDAGVRAAIEGLLRSVGVRAESYESPQGFLRKGRPDAPSCLVVDVQLPVLTGLEVQRAVADDGVEIPTIFIGHGDIPMTVQAMKAGAVEFLTKSFQDDDLLRAIEQALTYDRDARHQRDERARVRERYATLTPR
jgi:FixJ family two-component response regulator